MLVIDLFGAFFKKKDILLFTPLALNLTSNISQRMSPIVSVSLLVIAIRENLFHS